MVQQVRSPHDRRDRDMGSRVEFEARDPDVGRAEPPRPHTTTSPLVTAVVWMRWYGWWRLVASAFAVAVVAAGMWWLLKAPARPVEQSLPRAAPSSPSTGSATLPTVGANSQPSLGGDAPNEKLVVHVAGHVHAPGVYPLDSSARTIDAIQAAGGATDQGEVGALNLAAPLSDGQRVYVPAVGEVDAATAVNSGAENTSAAGPVNINTADATALETLPGVGPATARAIVEDRERNGPFSSVDDLDRVPGIGPAKLATLADLVTH